MCNFIAAGELWHDFDDFTIYVIENLCIQIVVDCRDSLHGEG